MLSGCTETGLCFPEFAAWPTTAPLGRPIAVALRRSNEGPAFTQQNGEPNRRLRDLLRVPERERTDPQWDEIAVLEHQLAPGNKIESMKRRVDPHSASNARGPTKPVMRTARGIESGNRKQERKAPIPSSKRS